MGNPTQKQQTCPFPHIIVLILFYLYNSITKSSKSDHHSSQCFPNIGIQSEASCGPMETLLQRMSDPPFSTNMLQRKTWVTWVWTEGMSAIHTTAAGLVEPIPNSVGQVEKITSSYRLGLGLTQFTNITISARLLLLLISGWKQVNLVIHPWVLSHCFIISKRIVYYSSLPNNYQTINWV